MRVEAHSIIIRRALVVAFGLGMGLLVATPAGALHQNCLHVDSSGAVVDDEMTTDTPMPCAVPDRTFSGTGSAGEGGAGGGAGLGAVPTRIDAGAGGATAGAGNAVTATAAAGAVALAVAGHRVLRRRRY